MTSLAWHVLAPLNAYMVGFDAITINDWVTEMFALVSPSSVKPPVNTSTSAPTTSVPLDRLPSPHPEASCTAVVTDVKSVALSGGGSASAGGVMLPLSTFCAWWRRNQV